MGKPLSNDLRIRVLAAVADGMSNRAAAKRFGVGASTVAGWIVLERERGHAEPKPMGGDRRSWRIEAVREVILGLVEETPGLTIAEVQAALQERGHEFAYSTVRNFLRRHGMERRNRRKDPTR